jgi:hypothetical protein
MAPTAPTAQVGPTGGSSARARSAREILEWPGGIAMRNPQVRPKMCPAAAAEAIVRAE